MNELTKNLMCVVMRDGIEIWIDEDKVDALQKMLEKNRFVRIGKQVINVADVSGVYEAKTMEEKTRRKNGQWKCEAGYWHEKNQECGHHNLPGYFSNT